MSFFDHLHEQSLYLKTGYQVQWKSISDLISDLYEQQCSNHPQLKHNLLLRQKVFRVKSIHTNQKRSTENGAK